MKHRHRWTPWKRVMTMWNGLMWWRYCKGWCPAHEHVKVRPKVKSKGR